MPRLDNLPALEVIRGLRGILDFYYWKGIPCVRTWPHIPPSHRSAKSLASAHLFGAVVQGYALLGGALKDLFEENAADQPRTARDLYVSAALGHLHDHNMSDFLDLLTEATAYLKALAELRNALNDVGTDELRALPAYDGEDWQALLVDAQRHLQADILASALPTDAATDANQVTMITALQLIDDLRGALASVHTDRLKVRGEDQLFTFLAPLGLRNTETNAVAPDDSVLSTPVFDGQIWTITQIGAFNNTTACTAIRLETTIGGQTLWLKSETPAPLNHIVNWQGVIHLVKDDRITATFEGVTNGDDLYLDIAGHKMTPET